VKLKELILTYQTLFFNFDMLLAHQSTGPCNISSQHQDWWQTTPNVYCT